MLKAKYNNIIIGKNYLSIIYGMLKLKKNPNSVLIIDDPDTKMGNHWYKNIGEIEKQVLIQIGKKYNIDTLKNINISLKPTNTIIFLNDKMIEFGTSPFANIREIARKLPECFPMSSLQRLNEIGPESFNELCEEFFKNMADNIFQTNNELSFLTQNIEIEKIFEDFLLFINKSGLITEQLHYVLQILFQTFFSNIKDNNESKYLLISILSPRYELLENLLADDLVFEFKSNGGELVSAEVNNWEIYQSELKYLLLSSVDGIIGFDEAFLFSRIPKKSPFERKLTDMEFDSICLRCPIDHDIINFYKNKRILFSKFDRIGTDFPHLEVKINEEGILFGTYSYANYMGTKPSFYFKKVAEDVFNSLKEVLPGLNKDDWSHHIDYLEGGDFWTENLSTNLDSKKLKKFGHELYNKESHTLIRNISYFGPNRTKRMGLYSFFRELLMSLE